MVQERIKSSRASLMSGSTASRPTTVVGGHVRTFVVVDSPLVSEKNVPPHQKGPGIARQRQIDRGTTGTRAVNTTRARHWRVLTRRLRSGHLCHSSITSEQHASPCRRMTISPRAPDTCPQPVFTSGNIAQTWIKRLSKCIRMVLDDRKGRVLPL